MARLGPQVCWCNYGGLCINTKPPIEPLKPLQSTFHSDCFRGALPLMFYRRSTPLHTCSQHRPRARWPGGVEARTKQRFAGPDELGRGMLENQDKNIGWIAICYEYGTILGWYLFFCYMGVTRVCMVLHPCFLFGYSTMELNTFQHESNWSKKAKNAISTAPTMSSDCGHLVVWYLLEKHY